MEESSKAQILIVDDATSNLHLLSAILVNAGYEVFKASNGRDALAMAEKISPDLILLDIVMSEMDGYEVCRQLKGQIKTRNIPVIFISALDETFDKVNAFSTGGVDYVSKPFQAEEVLARVQTHLTIRHLQQDLLDQIAELDAFAHTVAHDLKNPLALIIGFTELLVTDDDEMPPEQQKELMQNVLKSGQKAVNIIEELLLLSSVRKQDVPLQEVDMARVVNEAKKRLQHLITINQGDIKLPETWPKALGYAPWLEEVWANYLSNAMKYGGDTPQAELGGTVEPDGRVRFWVRDNGPGLTDAQQATLFAEFTRLDEIRADGHGLGLSIVRRIMDKLGGEVGVESELGQGSTFYFILPSANSTEQSG